ncbi:MAG: hypothetical protein MJZ12_05345 [Prevotella sp.]|nr:hypothetical protein [Prevotella sp.]
MKKKEFQKPEIKLVKMEQNISILAASGDDTPTGFSLDLSVGHTPQKAFNKAFR